MPETYILAVKMGDHTLDISITQTGPTLTVAEAREMLVRVAILLTQPNQLDRMAQEICDEKKGITRIK